MMVSVSVSVVVVVMVVVLWQSEWREGDKTKRMQHTWWWWCP
jgi:hypothetical protein